MSDLDAFVSESDESTSESSTAGKRKRKKSAGGAKKRVTSNELMGGDEANLPGVELAQMADAVNVSREADSAQERLRDLERRVEREARGTWAEAQLDDYRAALRVEEKVAECRRSDAGGEIVAPIDRPNFGMKTVLDQITEPIFGPHDWISDRRAADAMVDGLADEVGAAHQAILQRLVPHSAARCPPRGTQVREPVPGSVEEMRFKRWQLLTTPPMYTTNVVGTMYIGCPINVVRLVERGGGTCFKPRCFASVMWRSERASHLLFSDGKAVCVGANSVLQARIACEDLVMLLKRCQLPATNGNFRVENVVSSMHAGFPVDIEAIAKAYPLNAEYTRSKFPGMVFRISNDKKKLVFIVFKTGNCINTGMNSRLDALIAWRWFHSNVLWHFEERVGLGRQLMRGARAAEAAAAADIDAAEAHVEQVCRAVQELSAEHSGKLCARYSNGEQLPDDGRAYDLVLDQLAERLHKRPEGGLDALERWLDAQEQRRERVD